MILTRIDSNIVGDVSTYCWLLQYKLIEKNMLCLMRFLYFCFSALCSYVKMEVCDQTELIGCTKPLSEVAEFSGLSFLSQKSDLDKLCP